MLSLYHWTNKKQYANITTIKTIMFMWIILKYLLPQIKCHCLCRLLCMLYWRSNASKCNRFWGERLNISLNLKNEQYVHVSQASFVDLALFMFDPHTVCNFQLYAIQWNISLLFLLQKHVECLSWMYDEHSELKRGTHALHESNE